MSVVLLLHFYYYKKCKDFCRLSPGTLVQEFLRSIQLGIEMLCHTACRSFIFTRLCQIVFQGCFVVVQSLYHITLWPYMYCSVPGFTVLHYFPKFAQTHVRWVSDAIQSSHPRSTPSPSALNLSQHQGATLTNSGWVPVISYSAWYYQIFLSQKLCYEMVSCHLNLHFP